MTEFLGFDLETEGDEEGFALQPWRAKAGTGRVTMSSAWGPGMDQVSVGPPSPRLLDRVRQVGARVGLWNGIFDLAWMYASGCDIRRIMWYDGLTLWKWLDNGQVSPMKRNLLAAVETFLPDWEHFEEFLEIKDTDVKPGEDLVYWRRRAILDAHATSLVCDQIWSRLNEKQRKAATIQAMTLPTIAASWVNGVPIRIDKIREARPGIAKEMYTIEIKLGVANGPYTSVDSYVPSKILRSPRQMADLLYGTWGLPCEFRTEKGGEPAAHKAALTYLADWDDRVLDIMRWRELNTQLTKFIEGPIKAVEYLGSNTTHSQPRVFSTYTGRMTYSSKDGPRKLGIPIHQTPRDKSVRAYVVAPEGYYIFEADAKGQEMRGMATMSGDETMIKLFNSPPPYDNGHALTGSAIGGIDFEEFIRRRKEGDEEITGPHGLYLLGKFDNLSMQYRTGDRKLRIIARVQYGIDANVPTIKRWKRTYLGLYPGVKRYWKEAPIKARNAGHAETLAGRRYKIVKYGRDDVWGSESSAINFPIQGMGADQRDLAVATTVTVFPELWDKFFFDLHDGMYWLIPKTARVEYLQRVIATLDGIDYGKYWGVTLPVPYTWEGSFGPSWGSKIDFDQTSDSEMTLEEFYKENI